MTSRGRGSCDPSAQVESRGASAENSRYFIGRLFQSERIVGDEEDVSWADAVFASVVNDDFGGAADGAHLGDAGDDELFVAALQDDGNGGIAGEAFENLLVALAEGGERRVRCRRRGARLGGLKGAGEEQNGEEEEGVESHGMADRSRLQVLGRGGVGPCSCAGDRSLGSRAKDAGFADVRESVRKRPLIRDLWRGTDDNGS